MKAIKYLSIILGIVVLIFGGLYIKKCYIGNSSYENISISEIKEDGGNINITGIYSNNFNYKSMSYTLVGRELYVKITGVYDKKSSNSFEVNIPLSLSDIDNIHLTDDKSTKVIYSKQ